MEFWRVPISSKPYSSVGSSRCPKDTYHTEASRACRWCDGHLSHNEPKGRFCAHLELLLCSLPDPQSRLSTLEMCEVCATCGIRSHIQGGFVGLWVCGVRSRPGCRGPADYQAGALLRRLPPALVSLPRPQGVFPGEAVGGWVGRSPGQPFSTRVGKFNPLV